MLIAYGMQALLGWLIFRQIGLTRVLALIGATLIVLIPAFTGRAYLEHIGLIAHWVILLAILFYVRAVSVAGRGDYISARSSSAACSASTPIFWRCARRYMSRALRKRPVGWMPSRNRSCHPRGPLERGANSHQRISEAARRCKVQDAGVAAMPSGRSTAIGTV
jgi:hypothetical protein